LYLSLPICIVHVQTVFRMKCVMGWGWYIAVTLNWLNIELALYISYTCWFWWQKSKYCL